MVKPKPAPRRLLQHNAAVPSSGSEEKREGEVVSLEEEGRQDMDLHLSVIERTRVTAKSETFITYRIDTRVSGLW